MRNKAPNNARVTQRGFQQSLIATLWALILLPIIIVMLCTHNNGLYSDIYRQNHERSQEKPMPIETIIISIETTHSELHRISPF